MTAATREALKEGPIDGILTKGSSRRLSRHRHLESAGEDAGEEAHYSIADSESRIHGREIRFRDGKIRRDKN